MQMTNTQPSAGPGVPAVENDEIDLRQLFRTLWRQRYFILGFGLLGAVLGIALSLHSTKYVSEGVLRIPGVNVGNYKIFRGALSNQTFLNQYLELSGLTDDPWAETLRHLVKTDSALGNALKPEFSLTDKDQKTFGVKFQGDDVGAMIGVRLRLEDRGPGSDTGLVLLAEYIRNAIILTNLEVTLRDLCEKNRGQLLTLRNEQLKNEYEITQQQTRLNTLSDIVSRNPEQHVIDSRQIVSLEKGVEAYLSPAMQLSALEIRIADSKLALVNREREKLATQLKKEFYCRAEEALDKPSTGLVFLNNLQAIQEGVFKDQDRTLDITELTWNELELQRLNWNDTYLVGMRFVVPPEGAEFRERKPSLIQGVLLGGILGGFLGIFVALLRNWWLNNRTFITARN